MIFSQQFKRCSARGVRDARRPRRRLPRALETTDQRYQAWSESTPDVPQSDEPHQSLAGALGRIPQFTPCTRHLLGHSRGLDTDQAHRRPDPASELARACGGIGLVRSDLEARRKTLCGMTRHGNQPRRDARGHMRTFGRCKTRRRWRCFVGQRPLGSRAR